MVAVYALMCVLLIALKWFNGFEKYTRKKIDLEIHNSEKF